MTLWLPSRNNLLPSTWITQLLASLSFKREKFFSRVISGRILVRHGKLYFPVSKCFSGVRDEGRGYVTVSQATLRRWEMFSIVVSRVHDARVVIEHLSAVVGTWVTHFIRWNDNWIVARKSSCCLFIGGWKEFACRVDRIFYGCVLLYFTIVV